MAAKWQQWMPFHIDKFRGSPDVQAMHPASRWGYLSLLASMWQSDDCTIIDDPLDLATESGLGDDLWAVYSPRIMRKFDTIDGGRLRNSVLYGEWQDAKRIFEQGQMSPEELAELSRKRREAGIIGNQKRWGNRKRVTDSSQTDIFCDNDSRKVVASDRLTVTTTETKASTKAKTPRAKQPHEELYEPVKDLIFRYYRSKNGIDPEWNGREGKALAMLLSANPAAPLDHWTKCLKNRYHSEVAHGERPGIWLGKLSSFIVRLNQYGKPLSGGSNGKQIGRTEKTLSAGAEAARDLIESGTNNSTEDHRETYGDDVFSSGGGEQKLFPHNVGPTIEGEF